MSDSESSISITAQFNRSNSQLRGVAASAASAARPKTGNNGTTRNSASNSISLSTSATTTTTSSSNRIWRRLNVVIVFGVCAMAAQLWTFRGGLGFLEESSSMNHKDCAEIYEMLRDAPLAPRRIVRNSTSTTSSNVKIHGQGQKGPTASSATMTSATATTTTTSPLSPALAHPTLSSTDFPLPRNDTNHSLVVIVLSRRNAFEVRKTIRETWATAHHDNVYFVLGQGCPVPILYRGVDEGGNSFCKTKSKVLDDKYLPATLKQVQKEDEITRRLHQEQAQYHDLLVMPHTVDMYRTLPAKLKYAYTFVHQYLPLSVQWVLKVDDDFFVRIDDFETLLEKTYYKPQQAIMVGGDIRTAHKAHTGGKWREVPQFPFGAIYPPFPLGSYGHAVTRPIVDYVATYQDGLFDYQGEDVSIGIWLNHPSAPNTTFHAESTHMSNGGDCRRPMLHVVGHDITPKKMQVCSRSDVWLSKNKT